MLKLIQKFINSPEGKKIFKKVKDKNTEVKKENKTKTSTVSKSNNERKGISASILNQSNFLFKKKSTTKKKTLLGG